MPLQKLLFKPGVNRENTRYTSEGGWYESDKVRFRQGTPEKIGGWTQLSEFTFRGWCRSLWQWVTQSSLALLGVGTNEKFYIETSGSYYDVTPVRTTSTLTDPFSTTLDSTVVEVTDAASGFKDGDFVTFYGSSAVGGLTILGEFRLTMLSAVTYSINVNDPASSTTVGGGTVYAVYQINTGPAAVVPQSGWGAGAWGSGTWGIGTAGFAALRIWNQRNFGQDLVFGQRGGPLYYWFANVGVSPKNADITIATPAVVSTTLNLVEGQSICFTTTGALPPPLLPGVTYYAVNVVGTDFNIAATPGGTPIDTTGSQSGTQYVAPYGRPLATLSGAVQPPLSHTYLLVSDTSRFLIIFGTNDVYSSTFDPMLIRWADQESVTQWEPQVTGQAGSVKLSSGSKIITALQSRQEILVWTDSSLYNMQYAGPPYIWNTQLLADNISIIGPSAIAVASNVVYWMGADKFYMYDGRVQTLNCDLRQHIYGNINLTQAFQFFAGTNEGFNEVWFFYCTAAATSVDAYVIYNYAENVWTYGTLGRTAWLDSGIRANPIAATYNSNIVLHETGVDDNTTGTPAPIEAYIASAEFDVGDGHNFSFVWRVLPDMTFRGSTPGTAPSAVLQLRPLRNSGSGYTNPASVAGPDADAEATITGVVPVTVDEYTGQVYIRVRARQMSLKIASTQLGTQWQFGAPRIDLRPDGRR